MVLHIQVTMKLVGFAPVERHLIRVHRDQIL